MSAAVFRCAILILMVLVTLIGRELALAEIPNPTLSDRDAVSLIEALAAQSELKKLDFLEQFDLNTVQEQVESELVNQWRGNNPEHNAAANVELWLSVPTSAALGPLPLSQTVVTMTFDGDSVVVSDSTAKLEAARTGIKIPVLSRARLFDFRDSSDAGVTVLVWPRSSNINFQAAMVCPDRSIVRSQRDARDGYAIALGEQLLEDTISTPVSFSPYRSLLSVSQQLLPAKLRRIVAARFGFRGEAAVEVLAGLKPAFAEVSIQTAGQLTKAATLPDSVRAPNPKARLQYVSTFSESVLSEIWGPLGAVVEFRLRSANPAGFEREVIARDGISVRRLSLPRSVANLIGFGEGGNLPDWDAGECAVVAFAKSRKTNYSRQSWSVG